MKNYQVVITETLKMRVDIEADSPEEAKQLVNDRWRNSEYVLDAECFDGVEFNTVKDRKPVNYER